MIRSDQRAMASLTLVLSLSLSMTAGFVAAQDVNPSPSPSPQPSPAPQFDPAVVKALPTAGSLTARVVQLNAGLVLEREEGAGLFPAEPSRFTFRGGSWTQTRIEIDGFDVTDPIIGGRALVWGAVELGEVDIRSDSKGTALVHTHAPPVPGDHGHFFAQANLGLFDSTGSTSDPIPALARGHRLFDGVLAASGGSASHTTNWSGALWGADVSRSERNSDLERATQRLGLEGRVDRMSGQNEFHGLAMYQGRRAPFGFRLAETRSTGLMIGTSWARRSEPARIPILGTKAETYARASYLRGTSSDPASNSGLVFERLVDGTPDLQVPHRSAGGKFHFEAGRRDLGLGIDSSIVARFSRATSDRNPSQPGFRALETLNGASAREWTFAGAAASRLAEGRASLGLAFGYEFSRRTRLTAGVRLQRVTVSDLDGERILGSTNVLPELRFAWRKSDTTAFFAEGSMDTPPVPLITYEAATKNAPTVSARRWRDLNGDGRATEAELGAEVAHRGPGSVSVDPKLSLPTMRRVMVGFKTKVHGLSITATAFARRDLHLLETALDPQGSEIARTINLADPSGDILGPKDDQILPVMEESPRSFTSSQFLLTNPAGHRALGEGAELGFATNAKHIHWGLTGAAFRDSGRGGNRGLRVGENDFGVVGESFDRTNADTYGYGRLFFDRAYSLRMYLTANEVRGFTFGAIARYDDGQPFARLVILNDLAQGPDFVQAIPRGRARLHYTLSVDARLARRFKLGSADLEISASVFNALGSQFEAEEQVVWLPDYRRITMVQPPRAFVVGLRLGR